MNPDPINPAVVQSGPTGPRTEEGKMRTRFNAVRHGLTGQNIVFTEEESPIYAAHGQSIHEHYLPTGPIEESLVRLIADCMWRQDRGISIEHGIFALSLEAQKPGKDLHVAVAPAQTWREECKELTLLTLYMKRIDNKLAAHKAELEALQQKRRDAEREAAKVTCQATAQPQVSKPTSGKLASFPQIQKTSSGEAAGPLPSPDSRVPVQQLPQSPAPSPQPPLPSPEFVFSPVPIRPATVPVKPEFEVPAQRKPDAA